MYAFYICRDAVVGKNIQIVKLTCRTMYDDAYCIVTHYYLQTTSL